MWSRDLIYHFIGIGGIGVSAVARVLHQQGVRVQGSDVRASQLTEALEQLGISVTIGHSAANIDGADVVVHSTAVPFDNVERQAARDAGIPEAHRSEMLGLCMQGSRAVGVTGTHGKGTVSAMITHSLVKAGLDPTFIIGGLLNNYRLNAQNGTQPFAVAEVDESDRSHLNLRPEIVVVNNLEVDHLNFYDGLGDIIETMATFINQNESLTGLALNWDDQGVRRLAGKIDVPFIKYGTSGDNLDYKVDNIVDYGNEVAFTAYRRSEELGRICLPIPGNYNADNAAGAISVLLEYLDQPFEKIAAALNTYKGLENRFTVDRSSGITIVKDYISHPTGMRRVLESAKKMEHNKIWCVFKPYRFTLMKYHGYEYGDALSTADEIVITRMYAAEERPLDGIDTPWFCDVLRQANNVVNYVPENHDVVPFLTGTVKDGDMVIFFGGDDFFRMADQWVNDRNCSNQ
ncbi:MAG: UDP-N-acetylmuramate--L-alanine ligase [Myxococcota bacterium]|nr:UDP-N-acetylmuramate--L-alanine ligase [Myxococcota bacterium]